MDKLLPQSVEAEQGVLGSIIIDPEAIVQVAEFLFPQDFYRDAHRTIYDVMQTLYEQNVPADSITLAEELERRGKLEDIGGFSYLASLTNTLPTSAHVEHYARIVAKKAECRRLVHAAGQIAALAFEEYPNALEQAERLLFGLSQRTGSTQGFLSMQELMSDYMQELDTLRDDHSAIIGVPTGLRDLDDLTSGLQKTDLIILGGRPGSGKTALATNIAYNAAKLKHRVAVFSLEMGNRQVARRLAAMVSGIDMSRLRRGWISEGEWAPVVDAVGHLSTLPIWMNDIAANPIAAMRSQLRRLHQSVGGIDLVVVDYLQLVGPDEDEHHRQNREQEIAKISRNLKAIAKEFDVPVLALAQLSRKVEERPSKIPVLSDLRESGGIENDADIVMFIYRDDYYAEQERRESTRPGIADVIVAKHRNGPVGDIQLHFKASLTRFHSIEKGRE